MCYCSPQQAQSTPQTIHFPSKFLNRSPKCLFQRTSIKQSLRPQGKLKKKKLLSSADSMESGQIMPEASLGEGKNTSEGGRHAIARSCRTVYQRSLKINSSRRMLAYGRSWLTPLHFSYFTNTSTVVVE